MSHLASRIGLRTDRAFEAAYWETFEAFFSKANAPLIRSSLLARVARGETGTSEIDRVCTGLRQTMGWAADAIEREALRKIGKAAPPELAQASENRATT